MASGSDPPRKPNPPPGWDKSYPHELDALDTFFAKTCKLSLEESKKERRPRSDEAREQLKSWRERNDPRLTQARARRDSLRLEPAEGDLHVTQSGQRVVMEDQAELQARAALARANMQAKLNLRAKQTKRRAPILQPPKIGQAQAHYRLAPNLQPPDIGQAQATGQAGASGQVHANGQDEEDEEDDNRPVGFLEQDSTLQDYLDMIDADVERMEFILALIENPTDRRTQTALIEILDIAVKIIDIYDDQEVGLNRAFTELPETIIETIRSARKWNWSFIENALTGVTEDVRELRDAVDYWKEQVEYEEYEEDPEAEEAASG